MLKNAHPSSYLSKQIKSTSLLKDTTFTNHLSKMPSLQRWLQMNLLLMAMGTQGGGVCVGVASLRTKRFPAWRRCRWHPRRRRCQGRPGLRWSRQRCHGPHVVLASWKMDRDLRGRGYGSFPSNQGRGMGYGSFSMWQVYRLTHGWCCVKKFAARGVGTWLWRGGNFSQTILVRLRKTFIISFFN